MDKPELLFALIELVILLVPIGGLVWKAARQTARIDEMNKDILEIEKRITRNEEKTSSDISVIKESISDMNLKYQHISDSLDFIKEQFKEIKGAK